jgi:uncharacterized membrane protein
MQGFGAYQREMNRTGIERRDPRVGAWRGLVVATASVILAAGACSPSKRVFDAKPASADAGVEDSFASDAGERSTVDAGTSTNTTTASDTTDDGRSSQPTECEADASRCPQNSDCRTYAPTGCDEAGKTACDHTNVEVDTPCADGKGACDGEGQCVVPDLALLGGSCENDAECGSGHCAASEDGEKVCCDTACDGACTACGKDGHCDVAPAEHAACGELACPQSSECTAYPPNAAACEAFGECATTASYCQPEYTTDTCANGGTCNGKGVCCPKPGPERECTKECPCDTGEGVCSSNDQCLTGYVCTEDAKAKLGFPAPSCLPAHCLNNKQDEGETSVDCGGGCGCRATYEVVEITGLTAGSVTLNKMSGDGSAFAATISKNLRVYPARVSLDGVVTEQPHFGQWGGAVGINSDGSVIVGSLHCADPPECTVTAPRPVRWVDDGPPDIVYDGGELSAVSSTGTFMAGTRDSQAFRKKLNDANVLVIDEMGWATDMSLDGEYIVGSAQASSAGVYWSAKLGVIPLHPPSTWTSWRIQTLSGDGKVFIGEGYVAGAGSQPFIWKDGEFYEFPTLPGATSTGVLDLTRDGSVVVGNVYTSGSLNLAFIWDQTTGIRSVLDEVQNRGVEPPMDWELADARFISDDGTLVVGVQYGDTKQYLWRVTLLADGEWLP